MSRDYPLMPPLHHYYNRFDPNHNFDKALFLAGQGLQSAELNEIQDYMLHVSRGIGDALFQEGNIIKGAACIIDSANGMVQLEKGKIYIKGAVREIDSAEFTIPLHSVVYLGIWYYTQTITHLEEPKLRDPAIGTRNYQEPGAARMKSHIIWGYKAGGMVARKPDFDSCEFYPIYIIENGILVQNTPPPQLDAVHTALARYDRETNGSYVVRGLEVRYLHEEEDHLVFMISEGKAHVEGSEVEIPYSLRVRFAKEPDSHMIYSDPYSFKGDDKGVMHLLLNETPLKEVTNVDVAVQRTKTLHHGAYSGAKDEIPDHAVIEIIQISQGEHFYIAGEDYLFRSKKIDWSLSGQEPAPGSSYEVIYRCRSKAIYSNLTETGFTLRDVVEGTMVLVDYSRFMPRVDIITLDMQGRVKRVKGMAHPFRPTLPKTPPEHMALATVYYNWYKNHPPEVTSCAIRVVSMRELEAMRSSIYHLYDLLAQERLKNDVSAREPSAKKGVFVDPFFDDDMRDQGIPQTASIVDRELVLPIHAKIHDLGKKLTPWLLPYVLEPCLEQLAQTGDMKINPYQAFAPIPARVTITLDIDRWTEVKTQWSSPVTQRFSVQSSPVTHHRSGGWGFARTQSVTTQNVLLESRMQESEEVLNSNSQDIAHIRQATQQFEIDGFTPGEVLGITFDGVKVLSITGQE